MPDRLRRKSSWPFEVSSPERGSPFVELASHEREPSASATPATTATATVNADGSGTLTATAMQPVGDANVVKQPINAVVTWICVMKP